MMEGKRRTSSRIKAEPAAKRRYSEEIHEKAKSTPRKLISAATKDVAKTPKEPAASTLPTRITEAKPLPVLEAMQALKLLDTEYQSIKESGVLAAALSRSRQKWIHGAVFEKFWSKTKVTKGMTEEERKAAKAPSMTKVGNARLTAEPHVFDIIFHAVKDPNAVPKQGQLPPGTPFLQQYGNSQSRPQSPGPAAFRPPLPPQLPAHQHATPPAPPPRAPPSHPPPSTATQTTSSTAPRPPHSSHAQPSPPQPTPRPPQTKGGPPPVPTAPQPDPVIHALAQRASTDIELKSVMKIVATGKATQQQLEYFQKHIDELTKEVKARQEAEAKQKRAAAAAAAQAQAAAQRQQQNLANASRAQVVSVPPPLPRQVQGYNHAPPPVVARPRVPAVAPLHVVIQFSENSNDRFLFPKNCIIEYLPLRPPPEPATALFSFTVVKKGCEAAEPGRFDKDKEYWEPVTVQITGDQTMLMTLGKYLNSAEEVKKDMESVMARCTRSEDVFLAMRLPREKGGGEDVVMSG
ncbi:hypothetical protein EJ08DRAFT_728819 [Tothia fuscella]|uniref:SWR1-complex protein 3 domain-containing protein n=1 Tax=Tothia fuscella TaxID=1048955 RepID=A0A9P4P489_9PEZI|nr:hypothetical protein EJ08DRAFT_728819 [Tothia fuscella]